MKRSQRGSQQLRCDQIVCAWIQRIIKHIFKRETGKKHWLDHRNTGAIPQFTHIIFCLKKCTLFCNIKIHLSVNIYSVLIDRYNILYMLGIFSRLGIFILVVYVLCLFLKRYFFSILSQLLPAVTMETINASLSLSEEKTPDYLAG